MPHLHAFMLWGPKQKKLKKPQFEQSIPRSNSKMCYTDQQHEIAWEPMRNTSSQVYFTTAYEDSGNKTQQYVKQVLQVVSTC